MKEVSQSEPPPEPEHRHGNHEILLDHERPQQGPAMVDFDQAGVTERAAHLIADSDTARRTVLRHWNSRHCSSGVLGGSGSETPSSYARNPTSGQRAADPCPLHCAVGANMECTSATIDGPNHAVSQPEKTEEQGTHS